jgi:hypothetical protein
VLCYRFFLAVMMNKLALHCNFPVVVQYRRGFQCYSKCSFFAVGMSQRVYVTICYVEVISILNYFEVIFNCSHCLCFHADDHMYIYYLCPSRLFTLYEQVLQTRVGSSLRRRRSHCISLATSSILENHGKITMQHTLAHPYREKRTFWITLETSSVLDNYGKITMQRELVHLVVQHRRRSHCYAYVLIRHNA